MVGLGCAEIEIHVSIRLRARYPRFHCSHTGWEEARAIRDSVL